MLFTAQPMLDAMISAHFNEADRDRIIGAMQQTKTNELETWWLHRLSRHRRRIARNGRNHIT
jgi:hypothetical protein